jgi:protein-tyrosine phosphatase
MPRPDHRQYHHPPLASPRGGDWLPDEIHALATGGVTILVSLLTDNETAELELTHEAQIAHAAGLTFYQLPTPDRHVPERFALLTLATALRTQLNQGASIALHCRHGIGRASTLAAAVLVLDGLEPAQAWERIATARGLAVPDTNAQREFINKLQPGAAP